MARSIALYKQLTKCITYIFKHCMAFRIAAINSMPKHKLTNLHFFNGFYIEIPLCYGLYVENYAQMVTIFDNNKLRDKNNIESRKKIQFECTEPYGSVVLVTIDPNWIAFEYMHQQTCNRNCRTCWNKLTDCHRKRAPFQTIKQKLNEFS